MLPRKNRFKNRLDESFFKKAKRLYASNFTVFYLKTDFTDDSKIMIIVPKKVSNKAFERNLYKRIIKKNVLTYLEKIKSYQIVLSLKHKIESEDNFKQELEKVFLKLK